MLNTARDHLRIIAVITPRRALERVSSYAEVEGTPAGQIGVDHRATRTIQSSRRACFFRERLETFTPPSLSARAASGEK